MLKDYYIKARDYLRIKSNKQAYLYTFSITFLIYVVVAIVTRAAPFGNNTFCINDGVAQYIPFMNNFYEKIKNGESLLYSFSGGLGVNYLTILNYYLLSPFSLLTLLFPKSQIPAAMNLIIVLKMCCITTGMTYYLLHRFKRKTPKVILFSLAYGFSYFFMAYEYNIMWLDSILALPFILRGLELISTRKGKIMYTLSLFYCIACNFYLGALICIFLVFYFIFMIEFKTIKELLRKGTSFALFSILAALMASVVLLPIGISIVNSGTGRMSLPKFGFYNHLTYIFEKHLPLLEVKNLSSNNGDANLFITIFIFLLATLFGFNKTIPLKRRIKTSILVLFMLFCFNNTWGNFLMHGFYLQRLIPNRFAFLYLFLLTTIAYETFISIKGVDKKVIPFAGVFMLIIMASAYIDMDYSNFTRKDYITVILICFYTLFFILFYCIKFVRNSDSKLMPFFILFEILFCLCQINTNFIGESYTRLNDYTEAKNYIDEQNKDSTNFYREELLSTSSTNAEMAYNMNSMTLFSSIINQNTAGTLGQLGFASGGNYYRYFGHSALTDTLFGVKYIYSKYDEILPSHYSKIAQIEGINVYENKYVLPLGYKLDTSSFEENFANKFDNLNQLTINYGTLYRKFAIKTNFEANSMEVTKKDNSNFLMTSKEKGDSVIFTLEPLEEKNVYIYTKSNGDCNTLIKVNERVISSLSYTGYISYLGDLTKDDVVTIEYTSKSTFNDAKTTVFAASFNESVLLDFYENTVKTALQDVKCKDNVITGSISLDEPAQIMITIPYEKGWTATIDGENVEVLNINKAFLAIDVPEGEHEIKLTFNPPLLKEGTIMTFTGITIFALYILLSRKKKNSQKNQNNTITFA